MCRGGATQARKGRGDKQTIENILNYALEKARLPKPLSDFSILLVYLHPLWDLYDQIPQTKKVNHSTLEKEDKR